MRSQSLFTKMSVGIMVFAIAQTASADLSTGLVAHYLFSGNAKDASGNGHDGTVYGATPTSDRFGNSNGAYSFDGRDDYVRVPDHPQLEGMSAVTLSLWVRMDSIDRMTEVLNKWVAGDSPLNGVYNMGIDTGGQAAFQYCTGDAYVPSFFTPILALMR